MFKIDALSTEQVGPISLSISSGECIAIMGASGSGKSLFLRAIVDLDTNEGDVKLNGQFRNGMPAHRWRRLVSFVPAESGWWADRVGEHFEDTTDLEGWLKAVDLQGSPEWEVSRLSTGERHRLAIVRALQTEPKALLLDEPTASLDAQMTTAVEKLIEQQLAKGAIEPELELTAELLKQCRNHFGWSQCELARRAGLHEQSVKYWEAKTGVIARVAVNLMFRALAAALMSDEQPATIAPRAISFRPVAQLFSMAKRCPGRSRSSAWCAGSR